MARFKSPARDFQRAAHKRASFVGARAHDFHWLRHQLGLRKVLLPDNMREPLKKVVYTAADMKETPAREFLRAAKRFLDWQEDKM